MRAGHRLSGRGNGAVRRRNAGAPGAVGGREIVHRAGLSGKKQPGRDGRRKHAARGGPSRAAHGNRSRAHRDRGPRRRRRSDAGACGSRRRAGRQARSIAKAANAASPAGLEIAGQAAAEIPSINRPPERPQMIGRSRAHRFRRAVRRESCGKFFGAIEPQKELVGNAERQGRRRRRSCPATPGGMLSAPLHSTSVGTVTIAARARRSPRGVSTRTGPPVRSIRLAGNRERRRGRRRARRSRCRSPRRHASSRRYRDSARSP